MSTDALNLSEELILVDEETATQVVKGMSLPPQPQIMQDITAVHPDIDAISKIVLKDPAVIGAIIKTINSAAFRRAREIKSVKQAIVMMGLESVINIINAVLFKSAVGSRLSPEDLQDFWTCTNDVAVASVTIAKELNFNRPDHFYLAGLFHNCGIPMMMEKFPNYKTVIKKIYGQNQHPMTAVENHLYKTNHTVVGLFITRSWKLPKEVQQVVKHHHDLPFIREQLKQESHLANLLCACKMAEEIGKESVQLGHQRIDHEWQVLEEDILNYLGIAEIQYEDIKESAVEAIQASYS